MKVPVYDNAGKKSGDVELPSVFEGPVRTDLIKKAVHVSRMNRRQPYGASPVAGERHATASVGKGRGMSRVPRLTQGRAAALAPPNVGGRRAHPPEARKVLTKRMSQKERRAAVAAALAATAQAEVVQGRGHRTGELAAFPVVVADDFAGVEKAKAMRAALDAIGLGADLDRAADGRHIRAGMGKLRGRRFKTPRSLLIVTAEGDVPAVRNFLGVDVVQVDRLGTEHLAPGGDAGRLTVFTKGAIERLKEVYA